MKHFLFAFFFVLVLTSQIQAKRLHRERVYQLHWCKGVTEYELLDGTRVDCLLPEYAVEVDFASKWAESIGQALYYSIKTHRKAGVLLILEHPKRDVRYLKRLNSVVQYLQSKEVELNVWTITPEDLKN